MARWAIGDIQGCDAELGELLALIRFNADRDRLWFTGDLVNRGPASLAALRRVHALRDNAVVTLGNHDLHLLAVALVDAPLKRGDTLDDILAAPDRDALCEWLLSRPLAWQDGAHTDLLVHAGVLPQWSAARCLQLSAEVGAALARDPRALLGQMYGNQPDAWREDLAGVDRLRLIVNAFTRMRLCSATGRIELRYKGAPADAPAPWMPWFEAPERATRGVRVVFGHWSALGYHQAPGLLALDTGCVWGGALTAADLDEPEAPPLRVRSRQPARRT